MCLERKIKTAENPRVLNGRGGKCRGGLLSLAVGLPVRTGGFRLAQTEAEGRDTEGQEKAEGGQERGKPGLLSYRRKKTKKNKQMKWRRWEEGGGDE